VGVPAATGRRVGRGIEGVAPAADLARAGADAIAEARLAEEVEYAFELGGGEDVVREAHVSEALAGGLGRVAVRVERESKLAVPAMLHVVEE
jgi:hypothetical protein